MLIWPRSGFCSVFQGFFFNFQRQTFLPIFWNKYQGYWWDGGQHFLWIPLFFLLCLKGEVKRAMVWGVKHLGGERRSRPRHDCDTRTRRRRRSRRRRRRTPPNKDTTRTRGQNPALATSSPAHMDCTHLVTNVLLTRELPCWHFVVRRGVK